MNVFMTEAAVGVVRRDSDVQEVVPRLIRAEGVIRCLVLDLEERVCSLTCMEPFEELEKFGVSRGMPGCYDPLVGTWWPALGDFEREYDERIEHLPKIDMVMLVSEGDPDAVDFMMKLCPVAESALRIIHRIECPEGISQ